MDQEQMIFWQQFSRTFFLTGPPMRPSAEDLANYWDIANEWIQKRGAPRVLLLGVTPELYNLPWPKDTDFLAVDGSRDMIDAVWPGPEDAIRCTDWLSLDLPEGSRDIVLCDGGLHLLRYPQAQHELIRLLRYTLSQDGICIFRLFVQPSARENPDAVIQDLLDRKIHSLDILKLRLSMSLQSEAGEGVELAQVYNKLVEAAPDLEKLAARIGWPAERILIFNYYRETKYSYYWLTLEQAMNMFCSNRGGFQAHRLQIPSYGLGGRCPTIGLQCCSR